MHFFVVKLPTQAPTQVTISKTGGWIIGDQMESDKHLGHEN